MKSMGSSKRYPHFNYEARLCNLSVCLWLSTLTLPSVSLQNYTKTFFRRARRHSFRKVPSIGNVCYPTVRIFLASLRFERSSPFPYSVSIQVSIDYCDYCCPCHNDDHGNCESKNRAFFLLILWLWN